MADGTGNGDVHAPSSGAGFGTLMVQLSRRARRRPRRSPRAARTCATGCRRCTRTATSGCASSARSRRVLDPIVAVLDALPAHFDPDHAPRDILNLLARGWASTSTSPSRCATSASWSARRPSSRRRRGTRRGLELALKLAVPRRAAARRGRRRRRLDGRTTYRGNHSRLSSSCIATSPIDEEDPGGHRTLHRAVQAGTHHLPAAREGSEEDGVRRPEPAGRRAMRTCQSCGRENPDDRDFCECGEYLRWDPTGFVQASRRRWPRRRPAEAPPPAAAAAADAAPAQPAQPRRRPRRRRPPRGLRRPPPPPAAAADAPSAPPYAGAAALRRRRLAADAAAGGRQRPRGRSRAAAEPAPPSPGGTLVQGAAVPPPPPPAQAAGAAGDGVDHAAAARRGRQPRARRWRWASSPGGRERVHGDRAQPDAGSSTTTSCKVDGLPDGLVVDLSRTRVYLVPFGTGGTYEQEVEIHLHPPRTPEAEARMWDLGSSRTRRPTTRWPRRRRSRSGSSRSSSSRPRSSPSASPGRRKAQVRRRRSSNKANAPVLIGSRASSPDNELQVRLRRPARWRSRRAQTTRRR